MKQKQHIVPLYSKRAFELMQDWLQSKRRRQDDVMRTANGEIAVDYASGNYLNDPVETAKHLLTITKRWPKNTVKALAGDMKTYCMNGKQYSFSDLSLFACIVLHKYKMATLEKNWGAENVRDFIGHPANPLVAAQRAMLIEQLEQIESRCRIERAKADDDYQRGMNELRRVTKDLVSGEFLARRDELLSKWRKTVGRLIAERDDGKAAIKAKLSLLD